MTALIVVGSVVTLVLVLLRWWVDRASVTHDTHS